MKTMNKTTRIAITAVLAAAIFGGIAINANVLHASEEADSQYEVSAPAPAPAPAPAADPAPAPAAEPAPAPEAPAPAPEAPKEDVTVITVTTEGIVDPNAPAEETAPAEEAAPSEEAAPAEGEENTDAEPAEGEDAEAAEGEEAEDAEAAEDEEEKEKKEKEKKQEKKVPTGSAYIVCSYTGDKVVQPGTPITLSVVIEGYKGCDIMIQWQSNNGSGWCDIPGENGYTYTFPASAEAFALSYRVNLTITY